MGNIGGQAGQQVRCSHGMQLSHGFRRLQRGRGVSGQWLAKARRPFSCTGFKAGGCEKPRLGLVDLFEREGREPQY